jgi:hypothetical protein
MKGNKKGGASGTHDGEQAGEVFVETSGKKPLGRPRRRCKGNTKKYFKEICS